MKAINIKFVFLSFISAILLIVLSCQDNSDKPTILFVLKTLNNPFFVQIQEGAKTEILEGQLQTELVQFRAGNSHDDIHSQRTFIEYAMAQRYKAICITPSSSDALNGLLAEALKQGLKVVVVDTKIDEKHLQEEYNASITSFVGSDNYAGGQIAARYILDNSEKAKPRIVFFEGVSYQETAQQRKSGFMSTLGKDNMEPVVSIVANWDRRQAYEKMNNFLAQELQFDAIFASNDEMALGAIEAMEENGIDLGDKIVVGFDAVPDALEAINLGRLSATVRQKPREMGRRAVRIALDALENKDIKENHSIDVEIVN